MIVFISNLLSKPVGLDYSDWIQIGISILMFFGIVTPVVLRSYDLKRMNKLRDKDKKNELLLDIVNKAESFLSEITFYSNKRLWLIDILNQENLMKTKYLFPHKTNYLSSEPINMDKLRSSSYERNNVIEDLTKNIDDLMLEIKTRINVFHIILSAKGIYFPELNSRIITLCGKIQQLEINESSDLVIKTIQLTINFIKDLETLQSKITYV